MQIRSIAVRSRPLRSHGSTRQAVRSMLSRGPDPQPRRPDQRQARATAAREAALDEYLRGPGARRF